MSHHPSTTRLLAVATMALSAVLLTACGSSGESEAVAADSAAKSAAGGTVRVAVLNGSDNGLALAKADGSLDKAVEAAGGSVEYAGPFPAFAPAAEAIKAGAADITVGGLLSWVGGVAANPDLVVFAHGPDQAQGSGIVATAGSGIESVSDLRGKKVAVNQAGTGEYLLLRALETEGIDPKEVERVYLPVTDGATAFQSGKVDAWATWGNFFATAATSAGAKVVANAGDVGSKNDTVYVVNRPFLEEYPELVKAVFTALDQEFDRVAKDPSVLKAAWTTSGLPAKTIDFLTEVPVADLQAVDAEDQKAFQAEADFWTENAVIPATVDVKASTVDILSAAR